MEEWLFTLKQGTLSVAEYALTFCTLAAADSWNEPALKVTYHKGLNEDLITEMACRDDQASLESLIDMSIYLDTLIKNRQ